MPAPLNEHTTAILVEPMPCETCEHAEHCAVTDSTCKAHSAYVKGDPWETKPRAPDVRIGKRLELVGK